MSTIIYTFECKDCGYNYKSIEPKEVFEKRRECTRCGSKHIRKKVIGERETPKLL